jgi:FkbM family methyltransferase
MNRNFKFFLRRVKSSVVRRLNLDKNLFHQNCYKLEAAKLDQQELIDKMPGINMTMVIHPDMYFTVAYTKYLFEPESLDFIRDHLRAGGTFLDIGANIGYFSLFCSKLVAKHGCVIAFEPGDFAFALLSRNKELNKCSNLQIYKAGFGEEDGILEFNLGSPGMEVYSSLGNIVHPSADPSQFSKVSVPIFNGSKWLKNNGVDYIDLMKLDIEGGELVVVRGMTEFFREGRVKNLLIEMTESMSADFGYHPEQIISLLSSFGYNWYVLKPFGRLVKLAKNSDELKKINGMYVASINDLS